MSDNRNNRRKGAGAVKFPVVFCPKCHKEHHGASSYMDDLINCDCGFSFYVFVDKGLRIMMTPQEASYEPIVRAMRRFVVATGRCQDIDPSLLEYTDQIPYVDIKERDLDDELARALEDYQLAAFGECYITKELVDSICKAFERNYDVILNKKKDGVEIREVNRPNTVNRKSSRSNARILAYEMLLRSTMDTQPTTIGGGIMRMRQRTEPRQAGQ